MSEYLPKGTSVWLLRKMVPCETPHYCWWFDSYDAALKYKADQAALGVYLYGTVEFELVKKPEEGWDVNYLLFDLANGHADTHRYCWWFPSLEAAANHRRWQLGQKHGAWLSHPRLSIRRSFVSDSLYGYRTRVIYSGP